MLPGPRIGTGSCAAGCRASGPHHGEPHSQPPDPRTGPLAAAIDACAAPHKISIYIHRKGKGGGEKGVEDEELLAAAVLAAAGLPATLSGGGEVGEREGRGPAKVSWGAGGAPNHFSQK